MTCVLLSIIKKTHIFVNKYCTGHSTIGDRSGYNLIYSVDSLAGEEARTFKQKVRRQKNRLY